MFNFELKGHWKIVVWALMFGLIILGICLGKIDTEPTVAPTPKNNVFIPDPRIREENLKNSRLYRDGRASEDGPHCILEGP